MLYRLFTENKNKDEVCKIVAGYYDGFTVFEAIGYWQGKQEKSLCIEVIADISQNTRIIEVCRAIRQFNSQQCVLMQEIEVEHHFRY